MPNRRWMVIAIVLGVALAASLFGCGWLIVNNAWLSITASFADDQTLRIQEFRDQALATNDPGKAASYLDAVIGYYPSGTKQQRGTKLDRLVERHRNDASMAIIRHLRQITGKDLGNDPQRWLEEFDKTLSPN